MGKIHGEAKSVNQLLGNQKYHIAYYQRGYEWTRKQIKELIDDLETRFIEVHDPSNERKAVLGYGQYFLGSIIISEKDNRRLIVDGQQRLTSLTLLLIYLRQHLKNPDDQTVATNLIYSSECGEYSFNLDVLERNDCLKGLIGGKNLDPTDQLPSVQNLINRFNDIKDIFRKELCNQELPYFLDWLCYRVMLVEITTSSDDDAYTIFETMNDRGLSLAPTDMLKGYLLDNIKDDTSRARTERAWKEQIIKLRGLGKNEDADCIKAWLRSQYANKIRERKAGAKPEDFDKQGTEFHRWVRDNQPRVNLKTSDDFASFVTDKFKFYARAYITARQASDNYTTGLTSIFFNAQNNFTLQYPLMLAPLRWTDDEETLQRKMRLVATFIEITLARRIWNYKTISHSTMQYRAFLIMKGIRGLELEALRDDLSHRLSPKGADRDDDFNFQTEKAFQLRGTNGPQVHRLLARLTEFLEVKSGKEPRYPVYANRSSRGGGYQIEHIWADHFERHTNEFANSEEFATYRNRIGGLVLLPAADNASYSDNEYEKKLPHYLEHNLLARSLHSTTYDKNPGFRKFRKANPKLVFKPKNAFRKADLDERQNLYIALADLCWSPDRLNEI